MGNIFSKGNSSALPFINSIKSPSKSEIYLLASFKYESDKSIPVIFSFGNDSFQCISCVYLFHELPRTIRAKVLNEFFRVLEPGGILVLADSIQISDSPDFTSVMENFYKSFHEPFYCDYIKEDIDSKMEEIGFKDVKSNSFFMTKVWSAVK